MRAPKTMGVAAPGNSRRRRSGRRVALAFFTAGAAAVAVVGGCSRLPADWLYVTDVSATGATVVWTGDDVAGVRCRGPDGGDETSAVTGRASGLRYARVDALEPGTRYTCRLVRAATAPDDSAHVEGVRGAGAHGESLRGNGAPGRRLRFRTAPAASTPFTFAVVGDSGDGTAAARRIARRILAARPAFLLHLGDFAYPRGTPAEMDAFFFRPYRRVLARVPLFPTPGNHDLTSSGAYPEVFHPAPGERARDGLHYAFEWGDANFFSVWYGAFRKGRGDGVAWLSAALAAAQARPWRIVFLHEPAYTSARKGAVAGLRGALQPVLEAGRVGVVFAGHVHLYERSAPACTSDPEARVVSIVSGGGGDESLDRPRPHPNFPHAAAASHFVRVRVRAEAIDVWAVGSRGEILDHVRHFRDGRDGCRADGWPGQGATPVAR